MAQNDPTTPGTPQVDRVTVRPVTGAGSAGVESGLDADLERVRRLAHLLDSRFKIGGIEFGWDSIIGLVPGVGDVATAALALYPVWLAQKHKVGRFTQMRMLGNIGVDAVTGVVPVVGDLADVAFKANRRNLKLFEEAVERMRRQGRK